MTEAKIHHFNGSTFDDDGEVLLGFYFEIINEWSLPWGSLMGPYNTGLEAELACQRAYDRNDYK